MSDDGMEEWREEWNRKNPYKCVVCDVSSNPDDYQLRVQTWCISCDEITWHKKKDWAIDNERVL